MAAIRVLDRAIEACVTEDEEIHGLRPDAVVTFKRVLKKKQFYRLVAALEAAAEVFDGEMQMRKMEAALDMVMPVIAECIVSWNWHDLDTGERIKPDAETLVNELNPLIEQVWLITAASQAYFREKN